MKFEPKTLATQVIHKALFKIYRTGIRKDKHMVFNIHELIKPLKKQ